MWLQTIIEWTVRCCWLIRPRADLKETMEFWTFWIWWESSSQEKIGQWHDSVWPEVSLVAFGRHLPSRRHHPWKIVGFQYVLCELLFCPCLVVKLWFSSSVYLNQHRPFLIHKYLPTALLFRTFSFFNPSPQTNKLIDSIFLLLCWLIFKVNIFFNYILTIRRRHMGSIDSGKVTKFFWSTPRFNTSKISDAQGL